MRHGKSGEYLRRLSGADKNRAAVGFYFLLTAYYAAEHGCVGATWHEGTRQCFDDVLTTLIEKTPESIERDQRRERIKNKLGEVILLGQVPDVSRLPLEEILRFRDRRQSELGAFRNTLRAVAESISPELEGDELKTAIEGKLHSDLRPAIDDLKRSITPPELLISQDVFKADKYVGDGIIGSVGYYLSSTFGGAASENLVLGAAAIAIAKLVNTTGGAYLERGRRISLNRWSIVYDLEKTVEAFNKKKRRAMKARRQKWRGE